jgi:hypothetical protein
MQTPNFDPGLTQQYRAPLRRASSKDGSPKVLRRGLSRRDVHHPHIFLVNAPWPVFLSALLSGYAL